MIYYKQIMEVEDYSFSEIEQLVCLEDISDYEVMVVFEQISRLNQNQINRFMQTVINKGYIGVVKKYIDSHCSDCLLVSCSQGWITVYHSIPIRYMISLMDCFRGIYCICLQLGTECQQVNIQRTV